MCAITCKLVHEVSPDSPGSLVILSLLHCTSVDVNSFLMRVSKVWDVITPATFTLRSVKQVALCSYTWTFFKAWSGSLFDCFFCGAAERERPELIFHRSPLFLFWRCLCFPNLPSPWLRSCRRLLIFQNMLPGSKWDATFLSLLSGKQSRLLSLTLRCPAGSSPQSAEDGAEIVIMRRRRSQFRRTRAASRHDTCSQGGRTDWHEQRGA